MLLAVFTAASATPWKVFNVPHTDGHDDTPALAAALATGNYSSNASILFKKGITYNIWTPIKFPSFTNVEVRIEGNLTYPTDIPTIQSESLYARHEFHWLTCSIADIVGSSVRGPVTTLLYNLLTRSVILRASLVLGEDGPRP